MAHENVAVGHLEDFSTAQPNAIQGRHVLESALNTVPKSVVD